MTTHPRRAAAVLAATLALTAAGCTREDSPPASTPDPTRATDTAQPDRDTPPTLPDEARAHTVAGAKAFVRYYIDVVNYAFLDGEPLALERVSPASCALCASMVTGLRRLSASGGGQVGGEWTATRILTLSGTASVRLLLARISVSPGESWGSVNEPHKPIDAHSTALQATASWRRGQWRLTDLSPA